MRSQNSINNAIVNTIGQFLVLLSQFFVRLVFIKMLGDVYNSVNGLFTNILSFLSIAELGIGNTTCYSMFKSLAEKDYEKTNQYLSLFKNLYRIIGVIIFILGIGIIPFLKPMIGPENMVPNVYIIFVLYILKTSATYWLFAYRTTLIEADQKKYLVQKYSYLFDLLSIGFQIVSLFVFKSFIIYVSIALFFVIANNLFIGWYVKKKYPFVSTKPKEKLSKEERRIFAKNVYGSSLYKFSGTVYNSVDAIVISSSALSFLLVGYYANYMLVFSALTTLTKKIVNSASASIGNYNVTESTENKQNLFKFINFVNFWIYGVFGICALCLINPFIEIFFGSRSVINLQVVVLITMNFVMSGLINPSIVYRDACGLFFKGRFRPVFSALLNIGFSILFINFLGLAGVILGTVLSSVLTTYWYDPMLIYINVFHKKPYKYYLQYLFQCAFIASIGALLYYLLSFVRINNLLVWALFGFALFILTNLIFFACFFKTKEFKLLASKLKQFFSKHNKQKAAIATDDKRGTNQSEKETDL